MYFFCAIPMDGAHDKRSVCLVRVPFNLKEMFCGGSPIFFFFSICTGFVRSCLSYMG